ncbi:MAG: hypothetical protein AAF616_04855 [Bacteroidota bacterium]
MNKLNEQYFETKRKHKESYKKGGFGVSIVVLIITVSVYLYSNRDYLFNSSEITTNELLSSITEYTSEPLIFEDSLFRITIPAGFNFGTLDNKSRLVANDSAGLFLLVKVQGYTGDYSNLTERWENRLNDSNNRKYTMKLYELDSLNSFRAELATVAVNDGTNNFEGLIKMIHSNSTLYIIQGTSLKKDWAVV